MYEFDEEDASNLVKDLRKQREDAVKEAAELRKELAKLQTAQKQTSVADLFKAKGVNPKFAKWAVKDGVEDEAGLTTWLEENADLVGVSDQKPEPDAEDVAAMRNVQDATANSYQFTGTEDELALKTQQVTSTAELEEIWAQARIAKGLPG